MLHATSIHDAVASAVNTVNNNAGRAAVRLLFANEPELDFVADSAEFDGQSFRFDAGFDTFSGTVTELAEIRADVIQ